VSPETTSGYGSSEGFPVIGTREYREALRAGLRHDAAVVAAQDPRYLAYVQFVDPMSWQVAANHLDMPIEEVARRLVDAGYPRQQVIAAMNSLDRRDEDPNEIKDGNDRNPVQRSYGYYGREHRATESSERPERAHDVEAARWSREKGLPKHRADRRSQTYEGRRERLIRAKADELNVTYAEAERMTPRRLGRQA
jgi:hypothetical protein